MHKQIKYSKVYKTKGCDNMLNVKELKLKKIFNLKEYLQEKARKDKEYREYVERCIKEGEEDIKAGRFYTLEEFKEVMEKELGLKYYD